jgi:hypothetical protein
MVLPFCHCRRQLAGKSDLFFCAHPRVHSRGNLVSEDVCRMCSYWQEPPPQVFREFVPPGAEEISRTSCVFFGEFLGLRDCAGCRGSVKVKVFRCHHPAHGETTLRECETCPDFKAGNVEPAGA